MLKRIIEAAFAAVILSYSLYGCSNKINQTGSWLVAYDSTLAPKYLDTAADSMRVTSSQVNIGLINGSSTVDCIGKVPWTQADLLLSFNGLDSIFNASTITAAWITMRRAPNVLLPPGSNLQNQQYVGYTMDSLWNSSTFSLDSLYSEGHGQNNVVLSYSLNDSTFIVNLDTSVIRQWAVATVDSNVRNNGFILMPENPSGIFSVYSSASGAAIPVLEVACIVGGVVDTLVSTGSNSTYIARSIVTNYARPGPYRFVQGGTGLRESLVFDLSKVPNYSMINYAQLTLYSDTLDSVYYGNSTDSLIAYYITDPSTNAVSSTYLALSSQVGNRYTFNVSLPVQMMVNRANYGFLITRASEYDNVDTRILYDENAPDSLKPKLTITYSATVKK